MARKAQTCAIDRIIDLAKENGCENNPLFLTVLEQYKVQQKVIDLIRDALNECDLTVSKEYVKGRENVYTHPLMRELPKHSDSANKTAALLKEIIMDFGDLKSKTDGFDEFINEREQM